MLKKLKDIFKRKPKVELTAEELVEKEIKQQEANLLQQKDKESIKESIKNISCLRAKQLSQNTNNRYIQHAFSLLTTRNEDNLLEIIYYLSSVPLEKLSPQEQSDILYTQGLFYEAIFDIGKAKKYYNKAISVNADTKKLQEYKRFIQRYTPYKEDKSQKKVVEFINIINPNIPDETLLKRARMLEKLSLSYAKSPKSRKMAKSYFKEVMYIYRELNERSKDKYECDYIKVLLDGVEIFMLSPIYLKKAIEMLKDADICSEQRVYFAERVNYLKNKSFIKNSKIFNS